MSKFALPQASKNIRIFSMLSALALLLSAPSAIATPASGQPSSTPADEGRQHGSGMGVRLFERWDKDNDGRIAIVDLPTRMRAHMAAIDQNKDGYLTRDEFEKGQEQLRALREKEMDTNGDGKVSEEERKAAMRAHIVERFIEQDRNHDGFLTEPEAKLPAWEQLKTADANSDSKVSLDELKVAFDAGKLQPMYRGHGLQGAPMTPAEMKARAQERFNAGDKNHDGFLVQSEIPERWPHLQVADTNQDNKITFDELTAAFKAGKLGHQGPRGPRHQPTESGQDAK
jgi:Ca2+-binding EF-hand superfamily protein